MILKTPDQQRCDVDPLAGEIPKLRVPQHSGAHIEQPCPQVGVVVLGARDELLVHAGQRHLRMKPKDLESYIGERARRGRKLPRGFQKVDRLTVD